MRPPPERATAPPPDGRRRPAVRRAIAVARRALAPLGGRRRGDGGQIRRLDGGARNLMADVALDVGQRDGVFLAAEADGVALGAGARGAADAMHVVFGIVRQVEIEHVAHVGNVQAARGDVGGDQHGDVAVVEIAHHLQALGLRHVAGQGLGHEAVGGQGALEHLGDAPGIDEHHGAARVDAPQQPHEQRDLLLGRGEVEHLA